MLQAGSEIRNQFRARLGYRPGLLGRDRSSIGILAANWLSAGPVTAKPSVSICEESQIAWVSRSGVNEAQEAANHLVFLVGTASQS